MHSIDEVFSESIDNTIAQLQATNWDNSIVLGLSGGIDSVVLLHNLWRLQPTYKYSLFAIHVNHGIMPQSDDWQKFCVKLCCWLDVPITVVNHRIIKIEGQGLENTARQVRYKEFINHTASCIALAHHQDDQVETILSQIMRGSDLHNIAAMQLLRYKSNKIFIRPLLAISKEQITQYAACHNLDYVIDSSNFDTTYLRNFIRYKVMPLLLEWDHDIINKMLNMGINLQSMLTVVDELAANDLSAVRINDNSISIEAMNSLSIQRKINIINCFIGQFTQKLPPQRQVKEFIRQISTTNTESKPVLSTYEITLFKLGGLIVARAI